VVIADPVNWSLRAATAARSCSGASTRSTPSRARGVPRRCASWPSSPTRRSSAASSCTGPGASYAPANPGARPRADAGRPPASPPGQCGSPLVPAPDPGPLGVAAAHRLALAAPFSAQPHPAPAPNTPESPGFRPRPPTRCAIDAPPTRPDIRIGTKEVPSVKRRSASSPVAFFLRLPWGPCRLSVRPSRCCSAFCSRSCIRLCGTRWPRRTWVVRRGGRRQLSNDFVVVRPESRKFSRSPLPIQSTRFAHGRAPLTPRARVR